MSLSGRHPSSPSLDDDRHYQNVSFHQGTQDPRMGSQRGGRPPIFPPNEHQRPLSGPISREDMPSSTAMQRPASQQNLRPEPRFVDKRMMNGHHVPPPAQNQGGFVQQPPQMRPQLRGGLKFGPPNSHGGQLSPHGMPPPQINHTMGGPPPPQMSPQGYYPPPQMSPQYANSPTNPKYPPPTAPKPQRGSGSFDAPEKPSRVDPYKGAPMRPPPPEEGRRESPPPPPPPESTHPLLQQSPPKGPTSRDEARRRWRDEQIVELENRSAKTPQEEERMRTLRLERDFERRAEEAKREELDEEQEDSEELEQEEPEMASWARRQDEIRRKQEELEAAQKEEEQLLRDAQRRMEEESRLRSRAAQRLDSLVGEQSPRPPERGSSYNIMGDKTPKRVQFSEIPCDNNANHEKSLTREDPNVSRLFDNILIQI